MRGRFPSSTKNELASKPIAAPVSAVARSSTTSASIAPLVPPIGSIDPSSAAAASVVGFPSRSSAQPERDRLALLRGDHHLAARDLGQRQVDDERRRAARAETRRRSDSCRGAAAARLRPPSPPASCRWRARRIRPHRPARGDTRRRRSDGCSSPRAYATPSSRARRIASLDRQRTRGKGEPALRVDQDCATLRSNDLRLRRPVGAAVREMRRVLGDARSAVRGRAPAPPRRRARPRWSMPSRDSRRRARAHASRGPAARRARRAACG